MYDKGNPFTPGPGADPVLQGRHATMRRMPDTTFRMGQLDHVHIRVPNRHWPRDLRARYREG